MRWVIVQHQITGTVREGVWGARGFCQDTNSIAVGQHMESKGKLVSRPQKRHSIDLGGKKE